MLSLVLKEMKMDWADLISKVLVGSITGLIVAYFTASYALSRFYREKWWDKRANLYIQLVESIYSIKKAANYWHDEQLALHSGYSEYFEALSKDEVTSLTNEYTKANEELKKVADIAPLLLNDECKRLIESYFENDSNLLMRWKYDAIELEDASYERLESVENLLNSIIVVARQELRSDHESLKVKIAPVTRWLGEKYKK